MPSFHTRSSLFVLGLALGWQASAIEALPLIGSKNFINSAVRLEITRQGMDVFRTKLKDVLVTQAEFDPSDIYHDPYEKEWKEPIKWDEIKLSPEANTVVTQLRELLPMWFENFTIKDPRPYLKTGMSTMRAKYSRFALVTDERLLRSLGKSSGAVLSLELEVQEASLGTDFVQIKDLSNQILHGQVNNLAINIAGGGYPLKIRIPFYVQINSMNQLEFEALRFESNLRDVNLELKYGNLIVPKVSLIIDDKVVLKLNKKHLDKKIAANLPAILVKVRSFIAQLASEELPKFLNDKARKTLVQKLEEIQTLNAPGSDPLPNGIPHRFFWGLQLSRIDLNDSLQIQLNAFMEDDASFSHGPLLPGDRARGAPKLDPQGLKAYDLALSVDRGLINRILQLSFERGYFSHIATDEKQTQFLKLTSSPNVDVLPGLKPIGSDPKVTFLKIQTSLKVPKGTVTGTDRIFLQDEFEMSLEVTARLQDMAYPACGQREGDRGISILLTQINMESVKIENKWFSSVGRLASGKVMDSVKSKLRDISKEWASKGQSVGGCFDPPKELLGFKLDVTQLGMDPNGHLMIFFNYAKGSGRSL